MSEQMTEASRGPEEDRMEEDTNSVLPTIAHTPLLEWLVGLIGFVLVAGAITYLLYQGLAGNERPPDIQLHVDSIQPVGAYYLVRVRASNQGSATVKGLIIEGRIKTAQAEASTLTFDYLPAQSERAGGLFFTADPRRQEIELRALGYEEP